MPSRQAGRAEGPGRSGGAVARRRTSASSTRRSRRRASSRRKTGGTRAARGRALLKAIAKNPRMSAAAKRKARATVCRKYGVR